jgi:hypothetical protein
MYNKKYIIIYEIQPTQAFLVNLTKKFYSFF